jgi:hypothetical protein
MSAPKVCFTKSYVVLMGSWYALPVSSPSEVLAIASNASLLNGLLGITTKHSYMVPVAEVSNRSLLLLPQLISTTQPISNINIFLITP